jgi:uncharacterized RmlC-like cupin family protein
MTNDSFHPDLGATRPNLRRVRAEEVDSETAQTPGMQRFAAIRHAKVGSERLWMGETHVQPQMLSLIQSQSPRDKLESR